MKEFVVDFIVDGAQKRAVVPSSSPELAAQWVTLKMIYNGHHEVQIVNVGQ